MNSFPKTLLAAGAIALALPATGALAQDDLPPAVKARQAHMQLFAHNIGILAGMARGNRDYDAAAAEAAAANLAALARLDQSSYWQPGTDSDSIMNTRALPAIWENLPDVQQKQMDLVAAADQMAGVAGDGLEAVQANIQTLGGACGACHEDYQLSED